MLNWLQIIIINITRYFDIKIYDDYRSDVPELCEVMFICVKL